MSAHWKWAALAATLVLSATAYLARAQTANVIVSWNETVCAVEIQAGFLGALRDRAIAHVAMFEAVNAIEPRYHPYAPSLSPRPGASADAAAIAAAHRVMVTLVPEKQNWLDARYAQDLAALSDSPAAKRDGIAVGEAAADGILALRQGDGFFDGGSVPYTPIDLPGYWRPTPPFYSPAYGTHLPYAKLWTMTHGSQFRPDPPPPITSQQYADEVNEVRVLGGNDTVTAAARYIANFWEKASWCDLWDRFARELATAKGLSRIESARLFAFTSMMLVDGWITSFDAKFTYNQWRPVTAIREADTDSNPDTSPEPTWFPEHIFTPAFPDYISAHCTISAGVLAAMRSVIGPTALTVNLNFRAPRTYPSWEALIDECPLARIYIGWHFRTSGEMGVMVGEEMAANALQYLLKPLP